MAKILSFQAAQERREEDRLFEEFEAHLLGLLPYMSQPEKMELLDAVEHGDFERYLALTQPIIARQVIRGFNAK